MLENLCVRKPTMYSNQCWVAVRNWQRVKSKEDAYLSPSNPVTSLLDMAHQWPEALISNPKSKLKHAGPI